MTGTRQGTAPRRLAGRWPVFALLALTQFMIVLDAGIVNVALDSIRRDLGFATPDLAWVMDAYMLALGGFLLLGGRIADIVGRRRLILGGLLLFTVASLGCGLSTAAWQLVAGRATQGLGAALVAPAALALVTDIFAEGPQRNRALSIWASIGGLGGALGILLGGVLTTAGWQWAFLVNVPVGALVLLLGARMLPSSPPHGGGGMDITGAVVGTGGLCLLVHAVVRGHSQGWVSATTLLELAATAALLVAFAARQRRAVAPLVPPVLLRRPNVVLGNAANAVVGSLLFGVFFVVIALYLQQVRGYSPIAAALATVPASASLFVGSQLAGTLLARITPVDALAGGFVVQAAALAWWAMSLSGTVNIVTGFVLPAMVWCLGLGVSLVAAFVVCTQGVPGAVGGAAAGLVTSTLQIGGAVGVAILTSVGSGSADIEPDATGVAGYAHALWAAVLLTAVGLLTALWLRRDSSVPAPAKLP